MMSQQRNSTPGPSGPDTATASPPGRQPGRAHNAIPEDRILDATRDLLLAAGMRRLTMADIARHAEVSRATLYRRWTNVRAVVADLFTREFGALATAAAAAASATAGSGRERLVDSVVHMVAAAREHPLLRKVVELDPEFLTPYLLHRRGASTNQQLDLVERGVRDGIADGSVRSGDAGNGEDGVAAQARAILLTAWSFTLTAPIMGEDVPMDVLDAQLRHMLDRYLAP